MVEAIPILQGLVNRRLVLIGGLAVLARLSVPHRATSDVDTAAVRHPTGPGALEMLLKAKAAEAAEPVGVLLNTPRGKVKVDVIEVEGRPLDPVPEDANDALYELSHAWALDAAEPMILTASPGAEGEATKPTQVPVATPGPLVATKLQSAMNRGASKEATDLLDIITLLLDTNTGPWALAQLTAAGPDVAAAAAEHAMHWFRRQKARTLGTVRSAPEGQWVNADHISDVGEALEAALSR